LKILAVIFYRRNRDGLFFYVKLLFDVALQRFIWSQANKPSASSKNADELVGPVSNI
jgi:hypothetical protein